MRSRRSVALLLALAGFLAAGSAGAQFVRFSRCHAAYPCLVPFGVQYRPDPLIAGQYGQPGNTAVSGRVELKIPLKVEIDRPIDQRAIDEAVRKTIEVHGARGQAPASAPPAPTAVPPATESSKPKTPSAER